MGWGVILAWKNQNACETDSVIRFIQKFAIFFETEYRIRFTVL